MGKGETTKFRSFFKNIGSMFKNLHNNSLHTNEYLGDIFGVSFMI